MPTVGKKKFPYTAAGMKDAKAAAKKTGKKKPPEKIQNVTDSRIGSRSPKPTTLNRVTSNIPSRGRAIDASDPYRMSNGTQRGLLTTPAVVNRGRNGKKYVFTSGNLNAPGKGLRTPTSNVTKKAAPKKK